MKKKELIKLTRDIPDETIRQQVEHTGLLVKDYFLIAGQEGYLVFYWGKDDKQYVIMDDDEANNFAVSQYLLRSGVLVYQLGDAVPNREAAPDPGAASATG